MRNTILLIVILCIPYSGCRKKPFIEPSSPVDSTGIEVPEDTAMFHDTVRLSFALGFEEVLINKKIIKDQKKDGFVQYGEIKNIDSLDVSIVNSYGHYNFTSIKGIEYFTKLRYLDMSASYVKTVDLSKNVNLEYLDCSGAAFGAGWNHTVEKLDVTKCENLKYLDCGINRLTSLDVSKNLRLTKLYCMGNSLKRIDVSNNRLLKTLDVSVNREMTELFLSNCPELEQLFLSENKFRKIDVSMLPELKILNCSGNWRDPLFQTLDIRNNTELTLLDISASTIRSIDLSRNSKIKQLICHSTKIKYIDLSNLKYLKGLNCAYSELSEVDLRANTLLENLNIGGTKIVKITLDYNPKLKHFVCTYQDYIETIDFQPCREIEFCYTYGCPNLKTICVDRIPDSNNQKWVTNEWTEYITCK